MYKMHRNGMPRDFTLLRNFLNVGSEVFINKFGHTYKARFLGDKFKSEDGEIFTSPYAFSTYVTRKFDDSVAAPSGWEVIYTTIDICTGEIMSIKNIYDRGCDISFKKI